MAHPRMLGRIAVVIIVDTVLFMGLMYMDQLTQSHHEYHNPNPTLRKLSQYEEPGKHNRTMMVLAWVKNNFPAFMTNYKHTDGWFHLGLVKQESFSNCYAEGFLDRNMYPCMYTNSLDLYKKVDAVLFRGIHLHDLPMPPYRVEGQKWVFVEHEPPPALWNPYFIHLEHFDHVFNLTATFHSESDIPRQEFTKKCVKNQKKLKELQYVDYSMNKTDEALAVMLVSNCNTQSKREDYIEELRKYMKVDTYGACGDKKCGDRLSWFDDNCNERLLHLSGSYKFYLGFENSLCEEYVTEKLWKVLDLNVVPVVMGRTDYDAMMPHDTYINVKDYSSPKALADYLSFLDTHSERYNQYIRNKNSLDCRDVETIPWECKLCKTLHDNKDKTNILPSLQEFWGLGRCTTIEQIQKSHLGY